ncbi:MAG: hypothetical protein KDK99_09930 [Verrucomicrobiales bacterium]|nr:hypothetical protein [Verrucomicrobiales bacterium]
MIVKVLHRFLRRCVVLVLLSGLTAACLWVVTGRLGEQLRGVLRAELAERGLIVDIEGLGVTLLGGLSARGVRLYNDADTRHLLAAVDSVRLDFDYGQLLRGRVQVRGIELEEAAVALPVDPERPDLTVVEISHFNARAALNGRHLELRQARGVLAGIDVRLRADILLSEPARTAEEKERARRNAKRRLELVQAHRRSVQKVLDWLGRFEFSRPPVLTALLTGDTAAPDRLKGQVTFLAEDFTYPGYECQLLSAELDYDGQAVDLKNLHLKDALGDFQASASWPLQGKAVDFRLVSGADLPAVADALLQVDALREVVFYDQGPRLSLRGRWFLPEEKSEEASRVEAVGEFQCGRFASRGEVFEGLAAQIAVKPNGGVYIRNGLLRHRTGTLSVDWMSDPDQGIRHHLVVKLDPHIFAPFLTREQTRELLRRVSFQPDSNIFIKLDGQGATTSLADCVTRGTAELRGVSHLGVFYPAVDGEVEIRGKQIRLRAVRAERPDGVAEVDEVLLDGEAQKIVLNGVRTKCDPVPVVATFAPKVGAYLTRYQLPSETVVNMAGTLWPKDPGKNTFRVGFAAPEGRGIYDFLDRKLEIYSPIGELEFQGFDMGLKVRGRLFERSMQVEGNVDLTPQKIGFDLACKADRWVQPAFGKNLDVTGLAAKIRGRNGKVVSEVSGSVLGGKLALDLTATLSENSDTAVEGELRLHDVSFAQFAKTYTPSYETEGDLTGHFTFERSRDDWAALKGQGVGIIVNGNLYAVPILGPLTPLLGSFLPAPIKGYNVAKEANWTFSVADGKVTTDDLEALTTTFRLVASGTANFIRDEVDFEAQARFRGLPGLVFRPFSELLEYRAVGSIGDPQWKPSLFSRKPSTSDETPAGTPEEAPAPEKRRGLLRRLTGQE